MGDKRSNKLVALAQAHLQEQVLAAAVITPKGRQGAAVAGGLIGMAIHSATKSGDAFSGTCVFAITDGALHAFRASNNFGVKVKEQIGSWPWGTFGASSGAGTTTRFLFLTWGDGTVHELEAHAIAGNKFQAEFVDEVVRRAASGAPVPPPVV